MGVKKKSRGRKTKAEPVAPKSVRQIILDRMKTFDKDKKTAVPWSKVKRQLLTRQRKRNTIVDELR